MKPSVLFKNFYSSKTPRKCCATCTHQYESNARETDYCYGCNTVLYPKWVFIPYEDTAEADRDHWKKVAEWLAKHGFHGQCPIPEEAEAKCSGVCGDKQIMDCWLQAAEKEVGK